MKNATLQQFCSTLLSFVLLAALAAPAADARSEDRTERMKQRIAQIPEQTHIRVTLRDGKGLEGRLLSRAESDFQLQGAETIAIAYAGVKSVKVLRPPQAILVGSSPWRRVLIGAAIVGGILAIGFYAASQTR